MADIKLFVCCHQPAVVPEHPLLVPIQVGAALADTRFSGFLHDDTGDNISLKNSSYCELTAQYWAWKNVEADDYGFFHYRRYLSPDSEGNRPYRVVGEPTKQLLSELGYSGFEKLIGQYDLIAPRGENMFVPVWKHYVAAPHHHGKDLKLVEQIVKARHPEMCQALEAYFSGTIHYFGNIYIMKRELFYNYCGWLFPILEEFDCRTDMEDYSPQEKRANGYLAERLFGVYYKHRRGQLRTLELPRVHFIPNGRERRNKQMLNLLLPPGSWRRSLIKAVTEDRRQSGHIYGRTDFL